MHRRGLREHDRQGAFTPEVQYGIMMLVCCNGILPRSRQSTDPCLYLMYVWVRVYCAVAHRDYSSLHACKEEEEERCLFLEREW